MLGKVSHFIYFPNSFDNSKFQSYMISHIRFSFTFLTVEDLLIFAEKAIIWIVL